MPTNQSNTQVCPECHHAEAHSPMVGCLNATGLEFCDCKTLWKPRPTVEDAMAERDAAMATVQANTSVKWAQHAQDAINHLAEAGAPFSADDVWELLEERLTAAPHDPRALGPIMKANLRNGTIRATGTYVKSRRRHSSPIPSYLAGVKK